MAICVQKGAIPKTTNVFGMLSFQWWHLIKCLTFAKLICLLEFTIKKFKQGMEGRLGLESHMDTALWEGQKERRFIL